MRNPLFLLTLLLTACGNSSPPAVRTVAPLSCASGELSASEIEAVRRMPPEQPLASLAHYAPRLAARSPTALLNSGDCASNRTFLLGAGIGDITGPIGQGMAGYADPDQISTGILDRQFARAFVIESACAGRRERVALINLDIGLMFNSISQTVADRIAQDPELKDFYRRENLVLNATHSHATAAGQAHHDLPNITAQGHDEQSFEAAVTGTIAALRRAHRNRSSGEVLFNEGEVLNGTVNRSVPAYMQNPAAERAAFVDTAGNEVRTNRMMSLLTFKKNNQPVAMLNFYPIHGTSISQLNTLLSGDNKGFAAKRFEQDFATDYFRDNTFVGAFFQGDEGDNSPNIFIPDVSEADLRNLNSPAFRRRGGNDNDLISNQISGQKQYLQAKRLFNQGRAITGEVRVIHALIDFTRVTVPTLSRSYPSNLSSNAPKTCVGALGISFGGGAEDGRGPTEEGRTCANLGPNDLQNAATALQNGGVPPALIVPVGCNNPAFNAMGYDCHVEKPILFPLGTSPFDPTQSLQPMTLPVQIVVVGNVAVLALPWEVTTTSGRRLRSAVLDVLQDAGVEQAVISGLSNDYIHYLTTREEYSVQQYEGASTVFGPWSQEAVQQELVRLAGDMKLFRSPTSPFTNPTFRSRRTSLVHNADRNDGNTSNFGSVLTQPLPEYTLTPTTVVTARFAAGHPRNNLQLGASYLFVERMIDGAWVVVDTDLSFQTRFTYERNPGGIATLTWLPPLNTPSGTYRLRHEGASAGGAYRGSSQPFSIKGCNAT